MSRIPIANLAAVLVLFGSVAIPAAADEGNESSVRDGVYSASQAAKGKEVYTSKCAACHRESLAGGINEAPALKGAAFIAGWEGMTLRDLYGRIISTMPKSDPGSLSEAETLGLVAYILQENGFPAATRHSLTAGEPLGRIVFPQAAR